MQHLAIKSPQTERPRLSWQAELDTCVAAVEELNKQLSVLEDRLYTVLQPASEAVDKSLVEPRAPTSPLISAILDHHLALCRLIARVTEITGRIV